MIAGPSDSTTGDAGVSLAHLSCHFGGILNITMPCSSVDGILNIMMTWALFVTDPDSSMSILSSNSSLSLH
jgi:hypothetical protein